VLSSIPTQIQATTFNDDIDFYNRVVLLAHDREPLEKIQFGFLQDAELRYFVRSNVAVSLGVGQLRGSSQKEYLPGIGQRILIRAQILSVPVHVGADYYLAAYNQGDFQARAYVGAGVMSVVYNRALFEQVETGTTPLTTLGGSFRLAGTRDAPGYYFEAGAHMFFAVRYSVILGMIYRSNVMRNLVDENTGTALFDVNGKPATLDVSGVGGRFALGIGF
jgi:hypothetical protein